MVSLALIVYKCIQQAVLAHENTSVSLNLRTFANKNIAVKCKLCPGGKYLSTILLRLIQSNLTLT